MKEQPVYGTWIRKQRIVVFWAVTAGCAATSLLGLAVPFLALLGLLALPFLYIAIIISITAYRFGPAGGDYQNRIHALLTDATKDGVAVLDIGCGSGALIIKLARSDGSRRCVGVDYWGDDWEYSMKQCEENARLEGVTNVEFVRSSASKLPFEDGTFDSIVSCLTFHEVRDSGDVSIPLAEALRVLKVGGTFAFIDLFDNQKVYGGLTGALAKIRAAGGITDRARMVADVVPLRFPLDSRRALREAALITGRKT